MASVTTNMLDPTRVESFGLLAEGALLDVSTFFEQDLQLLFEDIDTDVPSESVSDTQISLGYASGTQLTITGSGLLNLSNGTLGAYTVTRIQFASFNGITLDFQGSVTYDPGTFSVSGALTSLDIASSWFSASLDISATSFDELNTYITFSHIELTLNSVVDGGEPIHLALDGAMTAGVLGLSGTVSGMTLTSAGSSFVATGLTANLANLMTAQSTDQFLSMILGGHDTITGTNGSDHLRGFGGNDVLNGGLGADMLFGGIGADTLNGAGGNDNLFGDDGADVLNGGDGADFLNGGMHADKLFGNAGNDTLDGGFDGANDTLDGGLGIDTVRYGDIFSMDATGVTIDLRNSTTAQNTVRAGNDLIKNIENVVGSDYNDKLIGNAANNLLNGDLGNDTLSGNDGADRLLGYDGNDSLLGGNGNDTLFGGDGRDTMTGGADSDVFYFDSVWDSLPGSNRDIITDFVHGVDKINLRWIDANQMIDGDQAFDATIASGAGFTSFSGIGVGKLYFDTTNKILYGNNDGDIQADFSIKLNGVTTLDGADFVL